MTAMPRLHAPACLVLLVAALAATGCRAPTLAASQQGAARGTGAPQPLPVPVVAVVSQSLERTLSLPGDLVAFQDVSIHARVQGFIDSIAVDRGSVVRKGALLARIVAPELQAQLSEAEAKIQTAEAQRLEAEAALISERTTFERLQRASATPGVVAGNDVQVAEQRAAGARARVEGAARHVEAMRQAARSLRAVQSYLQVTAPFDGVITDRTAHEGSLVSPSSGPIVRLQQVATLRLVAAIPEAYLASVAVGQPIPFTVGTFPGEMFAGTLARIARALDPKTRTMAVEIDVANGAGRLAPGMFAEIQWPGRRGRPSLFVPRTAVAATSERTFVIRVREGTAEWVDVKRGATMETLVEVFGNIKAGEDVAVRATDEIRAGTAVRVVRPAAK